MTYDDEMETRYERQEREEAAETRRVQREAGRAFDQANRRRVMPLYRQLTAERRAQVAHAAAVLKMLGEDGYALVTSL